jgi:hypothetical protein
VTVHDDEMRLKAAFAATYAPPGMMLARPKAYRAIKWEVEGRLAWTGRDWRRIKRERRKWMAKREGVT